MIRKILFWLHLSAGVTAGVFIFSMSATGVLLAFERQIVEFVDRDIRFVPVPQDTQPRPMNDLLEGVRRAGLGEPTAIVIRNQPQSATLFSIDRNKSVYVDPYSSAVLGASSARAHNFFSTVERLHRTLGAPLGTKNLGHWLTAESNLLFAVLIPLGLVLWLPRKWRWQSVRASAVFRRGLSGKAREWNWHNAVGIWCAVPLLVIALTGVVMSFEWANTLLFRLTGSTPAARGGERRPQRRDAQAGVQPDYEYLFMIAKALNHDWRTITLNIARDAHAPVAAVIDTGTGGQPQKRTQYLLDRNTGAVVKESTFADTSLGQRLRSFVRFGHTGEYYGALGQAIAGLASFGACLLVYTGLSLSLRRLAAKLKRDKGTTSARKDWDTNKVTQSASVEPEARHVTY
jgi:uncharacterized iron-regulated membrane protein